MKLIGESRTDEFAVRLEYELPEGMTLDGALRECLQVRLPDRDDTYAFLVMLRRFIAQRDTLHF